MALVPLKHSDTLGDGMLLDGGADFADKVGFIDRTSGLSSTCVFSVVAQHPFDMTDVTKENVDLLLTASTRNIKVQIVRFICLVYKKAELFSTNPDGLGNSLLLTRARELFFLFCLFV